MWESVGHKVHHIFIWLDNEQEDEIYCMTICNSFQILEYLRKPWYIYKFRACEKFLTKIQTLVEEIDNSVITFICLQKEQPHEHPSNADLAFYNILNWLNNRYYENSSPNILSILLLCVTSTLSGIRYCLYSCFLKGKLTIKRFLSYE